MTLSMIVGIGIGVLFAYRVGTIAVRIWRAWGMAEQEQERERQRRLRQLRRVSPEVKVTPKAAGLKSEHRRIS